MEIFITIGFLSGIFAIPTGLWIAEKLGLYAIVKECEAQVFTLFGKVMVHLMSRA